MHDIPSARGTAARRWAPSLHRNTRRTFPRVLSSSWANDMTRVRHKRERPCTCQSELVSGSEVQTCADRGTRLTRRRMLAVAAWTTGLRIKWLERRLGSSPSVRLDNLMEQAHELSRAAYIVTLNTRRVYHDSGVPQHGLYFFLVLPQPVVSLVDVSLTLE